MGRALDFPSLATLPVGLRPAPSTQGLLCVVSLDVAPFPALVALFRFQGIPIRLAVQYLGIPDDPLIAGPTGLLLAR